MARLNLKRLLRNKDIVSLLQAMEKAVPVSTGVLDETGALLWGEAGESQYPIVLEGETLGWVTGDEKAAPIALLLSYAAKSEYEKKELANETIERYKEITLLYNISEKISTSLALTDVGKIVIDEARKLITSTSSTVMLLNEEKNVLEVIAGSGMYDDSARFTPGVGIAGQVLLSGKAEIVNDYTKDSRFVPLNNKTSSLICAPIKTKEKTLGVINISNNELYEYTASDLKLLTTLTSLCASAFEISILHENKLKEERIKNSLQRYLSPRVVQAIIDNKDTLSLKTETKNIAVLFSDIRGFTGKCEELRAEQIVEYLNQYFTEMVEAIFENDGTVNKFVGDMIVAIFGAPTALPDYEEKAVRAAIQMQERLKCFPNPWIRENFLTGIGVSSGQAVVGNIGSTHHSDYTAIGDRVNTASRLQSVAKGGQILVTQEVYESTKDRFAYSRVGAIRVKGKKEEVLVYEVVY